MRILFIHADRIEYEVRDRAIKDADEVDAAHRSAAVDEALVCFATGEERDEANAGEIAVRAAREVDDVASQVKTKRIVLYPYAHLSSSLGAPGPSRAILSNLAANLREAGNGGAAAPLRLLQRGRRGR